MTIKEKIRMLSKQENLSIPKLEEILGFGGGTISRWDKSAPTADKLQKTADYFNVSVDYLLGRNDKIMCHDCGYWYDPLEESEAILHTKKHNQWAKAVEKYGFCWNHITADERELMCRRLLKNPDIDKEVAAELVEDILKAMFSNELREHNFSYPHDFNYFVAKQLEKNSFTDIMSPETLKLLEEKYETWRNYANETSVVVDMSPRDERDIKKDLDSILEKLSSKEYGPAAYDGEELSEESAALFRDELEIALRRLKLINKEKYNPNKNKK